MESTGQTTTGAPEATNQPAIVRRVEFVRAMTETELRDFALYLCGRAPAVVAEYMADTEAGTEAAK